MNGLLNLRFLSNAGNVIIREKRMLYNKCIIISALCVSMLTCGAAHNEEALSVVGASPSQLRLSDCFDRKTAVVPGKQRFCVPVLLSKLCHITHPRKSLLEFAFPAPQETVLKGVVGFIEGDDADLTQQIADLCSELNLDDFANEKSAEAPNIINKGQAPLINVHLNMLGIKRKILDGDVTKLERVKNMVATLFAFRCTPSAPAPIIPGAFGNTSLESIECPLALLKGLREVAPCYQEDDAFERKLAVLAQYAKVVGLSYEVMYLELNKKRFDAFLAQEFGATS